VESHVEVTEDSEASNEEDNNLFNPEALSTEHKILGNELTYIAESSQHDNDADHVHFVDAVPGTAATQPPKRPSGGFAEEDDLLFDS
jgi:hypothetical protein